MSKRATPSPSAPVDGNVVLPNDQPPQPAPRISGISFALAADHAFTTAATYRYSNGTTRQATLRLDPHRYDLMLDTASTQRGALAEPGDVAALLHETYYCLYAPRPPRVPPASQMGTVPDRP